MTDPSAAPPLLEALLLLAFGHRIITPDSEAGIEQLAEQASRKATPNEWRTAVSDALAAGYIYDPVRLGAGDLQCHWHLELTPTGVEEVLRLRSRPNGVE